MFDLKSISGVFTDIREAITGEKIKDPQKELELIQKLNELETDIIKSKAQIITAEAKSEHFLTSTWRPITMLVFTFIIANNYILVPYLQAFGFDVPTLQLNKEMWELLKIGIGGYVVGRSVEKAVREYKK
jgi:hypothetical protein